MVRYLGGLEPKYANVVELQQYATFDEGCVLAHMVEQQMKPRPLKKPPSQDQPFNKGAPFLSPHL